MSLAKLCRDARQIAAALPTQTPKSKAERERIAQTLLLLADWLEAHPENEP
jgi:hypothetical protein